MGDVNQYGSDPADTLSSDYAGKLNPTAQKSWRAEIVADLIQIKLAGQRLLLQNAKLERLTCLGQIGKVSCFASQHPACLVTAELKFHNIVALFILLATFGQY